MTAIVKHYKTGFNDESCRYQALAEMIDNDCQHYPDHTPRMMHVVPMNYNGISYLEAVVAWDKTTVCCLDKPFYPLDEQPQDQPAEVSEEMTAVYFKDLEARLLDGIEKAIKFKKDADDRGMPVKRSRWSGYEAALRDLARNLGIDI